jgi:hypothetical protein
VGPDGLIGHGLPPGSIHNSMRASSCEQNVVRAEWEQAQYQRPPE